MNIEPLEHRIAPALVIAPGGLSATYTDVDGDIVTVKVSKGSLVPGDFTLSATNALDGQQLQLLNFSDDGETFAGANLSITAKRGPEGGDAFVNVGYINSTDHDLGAVVIDGDLGRIRAGDGATTAAPGLKSLTAQSLGRQGTFTQTGVGTDIHTVISGNLGALKIIGDIVEAEIDVTGNAGALSIGGSLIGGADAGSGSIDATGTIGAVKIGRDLRGGTGPSCAKIVAAGNIAGVTIGGSIYGGGNGSGTVLSENAALGAVKIAGDVVGGAGSESGRIAGLTLAGVTIGGSVLTGDGSNSGEIFGVSSVGAVKIGRDFGGRIESLGALGAVSIGGSVVGGSFDNAGAIKSQDTMGLITIKGDLRGGSGISSGFISPGDDLVGVVIGGSLIGGSGSSAGTISVNVPAVEITVGKITIGGDIVGGTNLGTGRIRMLGDSTVNTIIVGGSIIGGTTDDTGRIAVVGAIGSLKIGGNLRGGSVDSAVTLNDSGCISAGRIGTLFIGGSVIAGAESGGGTLLDSGSIRVSNDLGSVTIKGSVIGNAANPVLISARGQLTPGATTDVAIGKLTIGGRVERANILAGFLGEAPTAANADAQIGAVSVGGDWIASNLIAGVQDDITSLFDTAFGDTNDAVITGGGLPGIVSRIASVIIKGAVTGTPDPADAATFGFAAEQIGSFKIGGTALPLTAGKDAFANVAALIAAPTRTSSANVPDGFDTHVYEV